MIKSSLSKTCLNYVLTVFLIVLCVVFIPAQVIAQGDDSDSKPQVSILYSYQRLLPLQGGSNFRDMGGYPTQDKRFVRRGMIYRSGVMTGLTESDQAYLGKFGFNTVVDLRSQEELDLYPNYWVQKHSDIDYINPPYSMQLISQSLMDKEGVYQGMDALYRELPYLLKPQLTELFKTLIEGGVPLVVNCSAGQDRTGVASALILSALGVSRDLIVADYLLSTQYRNPRVERGDIDLAAKAETNSFAKMLLRYAAEDSDTPKPLVNDKRVPYIIFALDQIEEDYGSINDFLNQELGVTDAGLANLQQRYLK